MGYLMGVDVLGEKLHNDVMKRGCEEAFGMGKYTTAKGLGVLGGDAAVYGGYAAICGIGFAVVVHRSE